MSQCLGLRPGPSLERKQQLCLLDPSGGLGWSSELGGNEVTSCRPRRGPSDQSEAVACPSHTSSRVRAVNVCPPSSLSVTSARTGATGSLQRVLSSEPSQALAVLIRFTRYFLPLCASELFLFVWFCFLIKIIIWLWPRVETEHLICP